MENLLWIGMILILTGAGYLCFRKKGAAEEGLPERKEPDSKLMQYIAEPPVPCQIYVGVPAQSPTTWRRILRLEGETLTLEGDLHLHNGDATTFIVANAGGEMIFRAGVPLAVPDGIYLAKESADASEITLEESQIHAGEKWLCISYGDCPAQPDSAEFYSIKITNVSEMKVRIIHFGYYVLEAGKWHLATTTRAMFTSRMFRDWYNLADSEWIDPGTHVTCPQVFGGLPGEVLWAFQIETYGGTKSLIAAVRN